MVVVNETQDAMTTPLISDAETLLRVATPDRLRVYEFLTLRGPARVGAVAQGLDIAVGSASHHLKVLDRAGFVVRASELEPDRRSHFWRAVPGGVRWAVPSISSDPQYLSAVGRAQEALGRRRDEQVNAWHQSMSSWAGAWQDAATDIDSVLRLSPDEASKFRDEVLAVIGKWRDQSRAEDHSTRDVFVAFASVPMGRAEP